MGWPSGVNVSDTGIFSPMVLDFPTFGGELERPKALLDNLCADRGYDSDGLRAFLAQMRHGPVHGQAGAPPGSGLGKVRWVVERTISWLKGAADYGSSATGSAWSGIPGQRWERALSPSAF
jgi:transposase